MVVKAKASDQRQQDSQIVGIRIPIALARDVKAEAARRGLKLNQLFGEMWDLYKKQKPRSAS